MRECACRARTMLTPTGPTAIALPLQGPATSSSSREGRSVRDPIPSSPELGRASASSLPLLELAPSPRSFRCLPAEENGWEGLGRAGKGWEGLGRAGNGWQAVNGWLRR